MRTIGFSWDVQEGTTAPGIIHGPLVTQAATHWIEPSSACLVRRVTSPLAEKPSADNVKWGHTKSTAPSVFRARGQLITARMAFDFNAPPPMVSAVSAAKSLPHLGYTSTSTEPHHTTVTLGTFVPGTLCSIRVTMANTQAPKTRSPACHVKYAQWGGAKRSHVRLSTTLSVQYAKSTSSASVATAPVLPAKRTRYQRKPYQHAFHAPWASIASRL